MRQSEMRAPSGAWTCASPRTQAPRSSRSRVPSLSTSTRPVMPSIDTLASPGTTSRPSRAGCLLGDRTRSGQQAPVTVAPARERARRSPRSALSLWNGTNTAARGPAYCCIAAGKRQSTIQPRAGCLLQFAGKPTASKRRRDRQIPWQHEQRRQLIGPSVFRDRRSLRPCFQAPRSPKWLLVADPQSRQSEGRRTRSSRRDSAVGASQSARRC